MSWNVSNDSVSNITNHSSFCLYIDDSFDLILDMQEVSMTYLLEPNLSISFILLFVSIISLTIGSKLVKIVAALLATIVVFYFVYRLTQTSTGISCGNRIFLSIIVGTIAGVITGCMISLALFIIGALSLIALTHLSFSVFPELHDLFESMQMNGKSLFYWACILVAGLFGGCLFRCHQKYVLVVATSLVGGIGFAYGLYGIVQILNVNLHKAVYFGIAICTTFIGIIIQFKCRNCKMKTKKHTREIQLTRT